MKKNTVALAVAAAMTASLLVGCGGTAADSTSTAESTATSTDAASAATTTADGDETLTVWAWDPNFNIYALKQAEAIYQKDHPNFKLDIQENTYNDIETKLITAATSGDYSTLPDVFLMQDYSFHKYIANFPDVFTDITDSGIDFTQFTEGKLADSTADGKHYGVPFDNGATVMAVRSDMIENAGLTVDDFKDLTWSEFIPKAQKVVDANGVSMIASSGGSEMLMEMLQSAGSSPLQDGKVNVAGIAVGYSYAHEQFQGAALKEDVFQKYGHLNIVIRDNYVKAAGGDGITVMYALRPLVKHNTADSVACEMNDRIYSEPGNRLGKVAAAIWPWKCKDALFRYNEVTDTRLNQDGMAYDADSGDGTVYEYNYSRMNEGGCVMFCLEEAIHNTFRHNVSYDDLGGTISPASNPDARLEQNIFYVRDGVPFVRNHMDGGNYTESNDRIIPIEK